jgi:hypothetical protein
MPPVQRVQGSISRKTFFHQENSILFPGEHIPVFSIFLSMHPLMFYVNCVHTLSLGFIIVPFILYFFRVFFFTLVLDD